MKTKVICTLVGLAVIALGVFLLLSQEKQVKVQMYIRPTCPYCMMAKSLLKQKGVEYEEIDITGRPELKDKMINLSGRHTVPQIKRRYLH